MKYEKGSFVVIPNKQHLKGCPAEMQSIFFWLCEHANDNGVCFPSRKTLSRESGCSIKTVDKYLKILEEKELLKKINRHKDFSKENITNLYQIIIKNQVVAKTTLPSSKNDPTPSGKNGAVTVSSINSKNLTERNSIIYSIKSNEKAIKQSFKMGYINNNMLPIQEEINELYDDLLEICTNGDREEYTNFLQILGLQI